MQTADFYSSATGTLRVNGGQDANAPKGVSLSVDDLTYIKQGSRANDAEPVTNYDLLDNKPQINNVTLTGNKSLNDLGIQSKIDSTHKVSSDNINDSTATNKFATVAQLEQIETNKNNISTEQAKTTGMTAGGANYIVINGIKIYVSTTKPTGTITAGSNLIINGALMVYGSISNITDATIEQGGINTITGVDRDDNTRVRTTFDTKVFEMGAYSVSASGVNDMTYFAYDAEKNYLSAESVTSWTALPQTINLTNARYIRFVFRKSDNSTVTPSDVTNFNVNFTGWH